MKATRGKVRWIALLVAILGVGCNQVVNLVGLDEDGREISVTMPAEKYGRNLHALMTSVEESVIPALAESGNPLQLRTLTVGAGVSAEVGIGVLAVSAFPRSRLIFTNSADPVIP